MSSILDEVMQMNHGLFLLILSSKWLSLTSVQQNSLKQASPTCILFQRIKPRPPTMDGYGWST